MELNRLFNDQTARNQIRQQIYHQKLLAYYGGTFPLEYQRRVNRGLNALRKLRAYWREREGRGIHLTDPLLPANITPFKRTPFNASA